MRTNSELEDAKGPSPALVRLPIPNIVLMMTITWLASLDWHIWHGIEISHAAVGMGIFPEQAA